MAKSHPRTVWQLLDQQSQTTTKLIAHTKIIQRLNTLLYAVLPPSLRDHCTIQNIKKNQIIIQTDAATWASRLHFEQDKILDFLRSQEDFHALQSIAIKVRPLTASPKPNTRTMEKLDSETIANLEKTAKEIHDQALKDALLRLKRHSK